MKTTKRNGMNMDLGMFMESECMLSPVKSLMMTKSNSNYTVPTVTCHSVNFYVESSRV